MSHLKMTTIRMIWTAKEVVITKGEGSGLWLWSGVNGNDGLSSGSCKWPKLGPRERSTVLWQDFDHHKMCHNISLKQPLPNRAAYFPWARASELWTNWPWCLATGRQITLPPQAAAWFNFCCSVSHQCPHFHSPVALLTASSVGSYP